MPRLFPGRENRNCCKFTCKFVAHFHATMYNIITETIKTVIINGGIDMPNIKPISELRNYTSVINEVAYGNRVYLTRNGHGQCAIIDMKELDELDKQRALYQLMTKLNEAEISIREEGTISAGELEAELGV